MGKYVVANTAMVGPSAESKHLMFDGYLFDDDLGMGYGCFNHFYKML